MSNVLGDSDRAHSAESLRVVRRRATWGVVIGLIAGLIWAPAAAILVALGTSVFHPALLALLSVCLLFLIASTVYFAVRLAVPPARE